MTLSGCQNRHVARETVAYGTEVCPKDSGKLGVVIGGIRPDGMIDSFLRCATCKTDYDQRSSIPVLGTPTKLSNNPLKMPEWLGGSLLNSTSLAFDFAETETKRLRDRVEKLEARLGDSPATPPAPTVDVRPELTEIRKGLDALESKIAAAKKAFAEMLPDAADLAYLKVAKADATEIRSLITNHIAEHTRVTTSQQVTEANRLAKVAIVISLVAVIAAAVGVTR
jgi:hypothetical protein